MIRIERSNERNNDGVFSLPPFPFILISSPILNLAFIHSHLCITSASPFFCIRSLDTFDWEQSGLVWQLLNEKVFNFWNVLFDEVHHRKCITSIGFLSLKCTFTKTNRFFEKKNNFFPVTLVVHLSAEMAKKTNGCSLNKCKPFFRPLHS